MRQKTQGLYGTMKEYCGGEMYPFHMPGHKRNPAFRELLPGCGVDLTEIRGFDNLHHAEGILKEAQQRAAGVYGVQETFFSVNGSTAALLAAVSAAVPFGGRILIARNCHKAVYHGICLRHLIPVYCSPQENEFPGLNGGILPTDIRETLRRYPDIRAVLITSPSYDGVVSDIGAIAETVHSFGIPLVVDEAHGAHFRFSDSFPRSAVEEGADVVIQSVHKTMPSLTQTALLHRVTDRVDRRLLARFLELYQSSSPSYLLMASIDSCIRFAEEGAESFREFTDALQETRSALEQLEHLRVPGRELCGKHGIADMDLSKLLFFTGDSGLTGRELHESFRREGIEMEMETASYVLALCSVGDTAEGLRKLAAAALRIDREIGAAGRKTGKKEYDRILPPVPEQAIIPGTAMERETEACALAESAGRISGEFVYLYPPGIPILVPGERISGEVLCCLEKYRRAGLELQGLEDHTGSKIRVLFQE